MPCFFSPLRIPSLIFFLFGLFLTGCASFDKTNILPGQRVEGLGFSFSVPTERSWFASEYGTGNRIKLMQLNDDTSYSIVVTINRGPFRGMFKSAEAHLAALQRHIRQERKPKGYIEYMHEETTDPRYGKLCVRYRASGEDWRGRNRKGPALVETIGLTCAHPELDNILVNFELASRAEVGQQPDNLAQEADRLFSSIEYTTLE